MKRQPMAVYCIHKILSGSTQERDLDLQSTVEDKDYGDLIAPKLPSVTQEREGEETTGYEDGLPVEDFLTKDATVTVQECKLTNIK